MPNTHYDYVHMYYPTFVCGYTARERERGMRERESEIKANVCDAIKTGEYK